MIRIGVARNAPTGPHSQAQNAMLRKTASGCRLSTRRPTIAGVRNWPSISVIADEHRGRQQCAEQRRVGHQTDHEQQHVHDRRPDIGNVVQHEGERAPEQRGGQPQQHRRDRRDDAEREIDRRHDDQIAAEIFLDVVEDFQRAQARGRARQTSSRRNCGSRLRPRMKKNSVAKNSHDLQDELQRSRRDGGQDACDQARSG